MSTTLLVIIPVDPMRGKRISSLDELADLRRRRKSVFIRHGCVRRLPAAVVMNWQAAEVWRLIHNAHLFEYVPQPKKKQHKPWKRKK